MISKNYLLNYLFSVDDNWVQIFADGLSSLWSGCGVGIGRAKLLLHNCLACRELINYCSPQLFAGLMQQRSALATPSVVEITVFDRVKNIAHLKCN